MRIVFSTDWFSEGMGYSENVLPAALARRGHEVYVVSSTLQVYGDHAFYEDTYARFLGPPRLEAGTKDLDGVTLIRLPVIMWWKRLRLVRGRVRTILSLDPDVVLSYDPRSLSTVFLALAIGPGRPALVSSVHTVASVYPAHRSYAEMSLLQRAYLRLTDTLLGWISARRLRLCYAPTPDAGEIAERFFAIPPEIIRPLEAGPDTALFTPLDDGEGRRRREEMRSALGLSPAELVCIYTGRLTQAKDPLCLAKAVAHLRATGKKVAALFLGEGEQSGEIAGLSGCQVLPFVPYARLPDYYRAADVGVWPRQESVSMLDAASCGLPVVVSDQLRAIDRISGHGLTYRAGDPADLAQTLASLLDGDLRRELGELGAKRMREDYSLEHTVDKLLGGFEEVLGLRPARGGHNDPDMQEIPWGGT